MNVHQPGWFKQLRRERGLFALVGAVLLLLNAFQPLALAGSAQADGWVICHGIGTDAEPDGMPDAPQRDCPICLAGLCGSISVSAKALVSIGPAFAAPAAEILLARPAADRTAIRSQVGPPPAIRAPPFAV
ncbi:MAG: hypothetical protein JJ913_07935 [Rhizobiaceae bacterium]|nr:hypothetical protein [Rhizobiaceae bacterium]